MEAGIPPKAVDFCPVNKIEDANPVNWSGSDKQDNVIVD